MINQYRAYPHNLRTIIRTIENADEDELSSDEKKKLIKQANQYLKDSKSVKDVNVNNIEYIQKNMKKLEQQICEYENEIKALENKNKTIDYDIQYINSKSKPSSRDDIEVRKLQTQKSNNYLRIQQLEANIVALKSDIDDVKDILKMEDYNSMFKVKVLGKSYKVKASDSYIAVKKVLKYRDRRITDENDEILNVLKSNGLKWSKVTGPDDNFYVWFESRDDAKKAVNVLNSKFGNSIKTSIITDSSTKMPKLRVQTEKQPDIIIDEEKLESALTKGLKNAKLDPEEYMIYNVEIYKDGIAWDLESALPRNAKNAIVSALKSADRGVKDVKIVGNGNTIVILTNRGYAFEI
jgi:predicted  nucleic acid-binding Zn-ribbon protein